MISRRTFVWFVALIILAAGFWTRTHWEMARCTEYVQQHTSRGSGESTSSAGNAVTVTLDARLSCQPGELEPWWAKCIILGAFATFVGTIIGLIRDVWIWSRMKRVLN